jgi:ribosomal protein S18 acetylase RimI-like enzyme
LRELSPDDVRRILDERADELVAVWPERVDEIDPAHLGRDGFRFVAEEGGDRRLAGIAYGYRGGPGQWWHDRVAAAMTDEQRDRWLAPGHFELVGLAVRPDLRGQGLGARLHDALLDGEATAVLSTEVDNEPARSLYRRRNWEVVVPELDFGPGKLYCIMGREPQ